MERAFGPEGERLYIISVVDAQSISRVTLSSTPIQASVTKTLVPPEEMNGSGMPLVGSSASTTLMLKKAWMRMAVVRPSRGVPRLRLSHSRPPRISGMRYRSEID